MPYLLPWDGKFDIVLEGMSREDLLRQRITRAFEKAQDDGVSFCDYADEWRVQTLADRLFDKIYPRFSVEVQK